ncbi:UNVERIFIED_CONTAM: hypothetical protein RKD50_001670 [Streptomyces canus]|jgi:hypothetical protein
MGSGWSSRHRAPSSSYACRRPPPYDGICATSVGRCGAGTPSPGLDEEWLRLAVRDRATVNEFLQALDQAVTLPRG